jgi:hypothetical protein
VITTRRFHEGARVTTYHARRSRLTFPHYSAGVAAGVDCNAVFRGGIGKSRSGRRNNPAPLAVTCASPTEAGKDGSQHEPRRSDLFATSLGLSTGKVRLGTGGAASRSCSSRSRSGGDCQVPSFVESVCRDYERGAAGPEGSVDPSASSLALVQRWGQLDSARFAALERPDCCAGEQAFLRTGRRCCAGATRAPTQLSAERRLGL